MSKFQIFNNTEFGELQVVMIGEKPYFPAKKCAEILGYTNPEKAVRDHCTMVNETFTMVQTGLKADGTPALRETLVKIIPEGDLYRLIIRSKLPAAERFERFVFDEVLPSIRKYGLYAVDDLLDNPDIAIRIFEQLKAERAKTAALEEKASVQSQQIAEMSPKASYYDLILQCKGAIAVTTIAKDYGKSAKWLNEYLHEQEVQYKVNNKTWVLYQKHAEMGYTLTKTFPYVDKQGEPQANIHTYWTQKGRLFLYDLLKNNGHLPLIEQNMAVTA